MFVIGFKPRIAGSSSVSGKRSVTHTSGHATSAGHTTGNCIEHAHYIFLFLAKLNSMGGDITVFMHLFSICFITAKDKRKNGCSSQATKDKSLSNLPINIAFGSRLVKDTN